MATAKRIAPTVTSAERLAECRHHAQNKRTQCAGGLAADGFLTQTFAPVTEQAPLKAKTQQQIEQGITISLQHLCALYGIESTLSKDMVFPYNIWCALTRVQHQLERRDKEVKVLILQKDDGTITLATAKTLDIGYHLYYIPISPVQKLLADKKSQPVALLLLSAFTYLHAFVQVPFCSTDSFVGNTMWTVEDWLNSAEEQDETEFAENLEQIKSIEESCIQFGKQIVKPEHLKQFGQRLKKVKGRNKRENDLIEQIRRLHLLYQSYPTNTFQDNLHMGLLHPEEEQLMYCDQYLSFWWGGNTWLDQQVEEWINTELQEMSLTDEPVALQYFDSPQSQVVHDLFFERELLQIIGDLNTALYHL